MKIITMYKKIFVFVNIPGLVLLMTALAISPQTFAQNITQSIKGVVSDLDSQIPLPGATVIIMGTDPIKGTVTEVDGSFRLTGVPVGRHNIQFSYMGYEPVIRSEVLVLSGKEVVLQVSMKETTISLEQVKIKAYSNKEQAINSMAMISARQLTMEEASRYAGGIDDPARLASAYAGVAGSLSSNAIVIRGNAPKGLLWRMEGVEISNPSHFANVTTFGGGGITALSSQMLSNSDFYTGAFPSEYGNALSGVFDMKMKIGNNEKHEYTVKAGLIGIDLASEGPFTRGRKSSYLFNYRYSTLALISPLLPENAQGLKYQDLSFKLNFPVGKMGVVNVWGLFSADATGAKASKDSAEWQFYSDMESDRNKNYMGAMGIGHKIILGEKTYLNTCVAITGNYLYWYTKRYDTNFKFIPQGEISQNDRKYSLSFFINHKFGARHTNRTGFTYNRLTYEVLIKQASSGGLPFQIYTDDQGGSNLIQLYSQSRFEVSPRLIANIGLHSQLFMLNADYTVEPRLGLKWRLDEDQTVSLAYGLHSRMEPIGYYLAKQTTTTGSIQPNRNLKLTKAHHIVLGYELAIGEYSRLRIEPFFQKLYDVPVISDSSFSMANLEMNWFFNDSLVNDGTGSNIGVDITLERFLQSGYYYLFTMSLFDSKYTGGDGITRNSRFNKRIVVNLLFGKEWKVGKTGNNTLGINGKFSVLGGDRISPVDESASILSGDVVYNENNAFTSRKPTVYYLDFSASWQRNRLKYSSTLSLQFVNLLFQKEFYGYRYNFRTNQVEPLKETVVIPNLSYRIDF